MRDILLIIEIFKQLPLKGWLLLLGVSIIPYVFTHMILSSLAAFLLVSFYIVKDVLSYKIALIVISTIGIFTGMVFYLWKPTLIMSVGAIFIIIHFGIKSKLPLLTALRNELIFLISIFVAFLSLLIGILMNKVQVVSNGTDGYVSAIAICIGAIGYIAYVFYKTYKNYRKIASN